MASDLGRLFLVRHGETEWSATGRHTGRTDVPLNDRGTAQAQALAGTFADLTLTRPLVISSPRARARDTAALAGLTVDRVWDDLQEWDYGDYEGLTTPQIRRTVPDWTVFTRPCPGGETAAQVRERADRVLEVALGAVADQDVVLVGHGHFSRALLARWVQLPVTEGSRFAMAAAGVAELGFEHGVRQIASLGRTPLAVAR
ncbi:acid phosphatase [Rhodococcus sp. D2-41]|uniref:acid phosphatase n=1 Tax=Speluncibacter jeojiensis TaxID=2710754 RepID=UPI002410B632|nr:acid phosphatase [Rhodococcus sp. D2-41]MDG3008765.1 acid phosphatase [Rhodococcus sp. D2-41]